MLCRLSYQNNVLNQSKEWNNRLHGSRHRHLCQLVSNVSSQSSIEAPKWTGEGWMSQAANFLIKNPVIYPYLKLGARQVLINTAEKKGVQWKQSVQDFEAVKDKLEEIYLQVNDPTIEYPFYYKQQFHAYEEGNLSWLAAFEQKSATYSTSLRTFKKENISPVNAFIKVRQPVVDMINKFKSDNDCREIIDVLDIGCGTGMNTEFLAESYPASKITGLDLSPYFISVAEYNRQNSNSETVKNNVRYVHQIAESTNFQDNSFDLISFTFIFHECPPEAITNMLVEAKRLLRPGGIVQFTENDPKSKDIQNLPPVLFTLMKSTEPWTDVYFAMDIEQTMEDIGFQFVTYAPTDVRHRTVVGRAP
eukprot:TRINITY_DN6025_c0_g1_i2.p1 TRINITY_DN6025_c0_g1~~TRINITY_DN6025_c0_g1_i2.p1  ORF type:complete len:369 (+),score=19.70 TRINITY_DN6025_c0_g1_i2:24-1109(+)